MRTPVLALSLLLIGTVLPSPAALARTDGVVTRVEVESLLERATVHHAPPPQSQDMRSFGADWSGGAQLFWRARSPLSAPGIQPIRSTLELPLAVPAAGVYDLTLHYTAAPDYGSFSLTVGKTRTRIDGYAPAVMRRQITVRGLSLRAGIQPLLVVATGKDRASSNHFVGLDRIDLAPVAGSDAASAGAPKDGTPAQGIGTIPDPIASAKQIEIADIRFEPVPQVGGKAAGSEMVQLGADQVAAVNVTVGGKSVKVCVTYLDFAVHNAGKDQLGCIQCRTKRPEAGRRTTLGADAVDPGRPRVELELQVHRAPSSSGYAAPAWQHVDRRVQHLPKMPC